MSIVVGVRVCTDDGWVTMIGGAADDAPARCYALPRLNKKHQCRSEFWTRELRKPIPKGRALVWEVIPMRPFVAGGTT